MPKRLSTSSNSILFFSQSNVGHLAESHLAIDDARRCEISGESAVDQHGSTPFDQDQDEDPSDVDGERNHLRQHRRRCRRNEVFGANSSRIFSLGRRSKLI